MVNKGRGLLTIYLKTVAYHSLGVIGTATRKHSLDQGLIG
jgi:hypothetical protein